MTTSTTDLVLRTCFELEKPLEIHRDMNTSRTPLCNRSFNTIAMQVGPLIFNLNHSCASTVRRRCLAQVNFIPRFPTTTVNIPFHGPLYVQGDSRHSSNSGPSIFLMISSISIPLFASFIHTQAPPHIRRRKCPTRRVFRHRLAWTDCRSLWSVKSHPCRLTLRGLR